MQLDIKKGSSLKCWGILKLLRSEDRVRNPLRLVYHWLCRAIEVSVYISTIPAFQAGKEELPSANFQLGK